MKTFLFSFSILIFLFLVSCENTAETEPENQIPSTNTEAIKEDTNQSVAANTETNKQPDPSNAETKNKPIPPIPENKPEKILRSEALDPALEGKRWIIVEVNGEAVEKTESMRQTPFIQFHIEGNSVHAYAGCNQMSGTYYIEANNRIRFSPIMATRMACEDMELETTLGKNLEKVDNYTIEKGMLSLNRAKMAPLVRLRAE